MIFDVQKLQQYFFERSKAELAKNANNEQTAEQRAQDDFNNAPNRNFNIRAIFSIFDANKDGKITREEFYAVEKNDYISFTDNLKEYNKQNSRASDNNSIWSYEQMEMYINDHGSPNVMDEDEVLFDDIEAFYMAKDDSEKNNDVDKRLEGARGFEETYDLKDASQMSNEEIIAELSLYGIQPKNNRAESLVLQLNDARRERAKYDIGSDKVDGHIGTFIQNKTGVCTVLAQIGAMNEEEIHQLFVFDEGYGFNNPMVDENGKKYWNIKFPIDGDNKDKIIRITEDEIKSGKIEIEEYGKKISIREFPEGDADITAITMAFVKRFGSGIVQTGEWAYITRNRFTKPEDEKFKDNQYLEKITDYKSLEGSVIGGLAPDELRRKGFDVKPLQDEDLSWIPNKSYRTIAKRSEGFIYTLSNGLKACVCRHGIFLSDGRKVEQSHAMEIRRYDEMTSELLISGSEFSNISELRLPIELLQFYETASLPGTPGVDDTPDPGIKEDI